MYMDYIIYKFVDNCNSIFCILQNIKVDQNEIMIATKDEIRK